MKADQEGLSNHKGHKEPPSARLILNSYDVKLYLCDVDSIY